MNGSRTTRICEVDIMVCAKLGKGDGVCTVGQWCFFFGPEQENRSPNHRLVTATHNLLSHNSWARARKVDVRPVHLITTMIKWIRTSRLSIKSSLSLCAQLGKGAVIHTTYGDIAVCRRRKDSLTHSHTLSLSHTHTLSHTVGQGRSDPHDVRRHHPPLPGRSTKSSRW